MQQQHKKIHSETNPEMSWFNSSIHSQIGGKSVRPPIPGQKTNECEWG